MPSNHLGYARSFGGTTACSSAPFDLLLASHASTLSSPQTPRATSAHSGNGNTNMLIGTAYKDKGLYRIEGSPQRLAYLSTISAKEVYCQLEHPSLPMLKKIRPKFQSIPELVCKSCIQGKHVCAPHPPRSVEENSIARSKEETIFDHIRRKAKLFPEVNNANIDNELILLTKESSLDDSMNLGRPSRKNPRTVTRSISSGDNVIILDPEKPCIKTNVCSATRDWSENKFVSPTRTSTSGARRSLDLPTEIFSNIPQ
ncbi:hypothetical protein AKJ16_DCAP00900, partial [Drosera capensis]